MNQTCLGESALFVLNVSSFKCPLLDNSTIKRNGRLLMEIGHSKIPWRVLVMFFLLTLVLYVCGFYGFEHFRVRKGPWTVEFDLKSSSPTMKINQMALGIEDFKIIFEGVNTNGLTSGLVSFDNPKLNAQPMDKTPESSQELKQSAFTVPFGECIYQDLMFLPGVVTMNLLGHEIELMPRTLVIDKKEIPWSTKEGAVIVFPFDSKD